jgi:hypothetical protein
VCQDPLLHSVVGSEDINIEENGAGNFGNLDDAEENDDDNQNDNGGCDENDEEIGLLCKEEQDSHRYGIRYFVNIYRKSYFLTICCCPYIVVVLTVAGIPTVAGVPSFLAFLLL